MPSFPLVLKRREEAANQRLKFAVPVEVSPLCFLFIALPILVLIHSKIVSLCVL